MNASWIAAYFWFSAPAMAPAESDASRRSSNGLSVTNTMPELGLLVKPLIDRPGNATALSTPAASARYRSCDGSRPRCDRALPRPAAARTPPGTACPAAARNRSARGRSRIDPAAPGRRRSPARSARAQDAPHATDVTVRSWFEEAVERTEQPAKGAIDDAAEPVLRRATFLQQQRGERRDERQRVERRDHRGDRDGQRELPVELAR